LIERPLGRVKKHAFPKPPRGTRKTVVDEFMLKEYENTAAAHFDSQSGIRQQFRFYLLLAAVPLTIFGLCARGLVLALDRAGQIQRPPVRGGLQNRLAERERPELYNPRQQCGPRTTSPPHCAS
jgi:hypothetical protein